ncbi:TPA: hypothetical protein DCL28_03220 [Candidatus Komeilibacteria bacterium]|nr:hypothetical protein [Candidatus Komeilibacteria bacterium]HCC74077.1 hypothetical protein [Candidatus Komeilibacteria bacterium]
MIYIILPLISAIFVLLIALIVISRGYSRLNTIFSLFCLATFIWLFGTFMMFISKTDDRAIFWDRFIYIGVVFMPTISYHFGAELIRITRRRLLIYASYFLSAVFLILSRTELFISGINRYSWGVHSQAKFFHHLFLINFIFLVSLLFYDLYIFYKKSKNSIEKNQIRYIFIALFILSLGSFSFLPAYGINIFPVFYLSGVFFTIILAYAIIKYRVFDIRQVISRGILYFILLIFVSLSFTFVTFSTAQFFEGQGQIWVTLLVSLIIVTGLDPLKRLLAKWTDAFFYKGKIDFQKVLRDISEIISSELDLEKLIFSLETNISHKIKVKHSEILIARTNANNLIFSNVNGSRIIQAEDNIADYLFRNKKMIITEELFREKTDLKTEPEKAEIDKLLEQLDNQAIGLVVPILAENKITAIFLIGQKLSGSPFTQEEIDFFDILTPQVATALEKSKLYEEVQELNVSLQDRVKQATRDLEERNRYLVALQRLTNVITRSLDYGKVMQTIADGISRELGFIGGVLSFIDFKKQTIHVGAISNTPVVATALKLIPKDPRTYDVSLDYENNISVKAIKTRQTVFSESFYDSVTPALPKAIALGIQKILKIKAVVAVPVYSEAKIIGAIDFVMSKKPEEITDTEKEMMKALADQVGIVSRNLQYYNEIQNANEELKQANIRLQQLDKAKSEFLSIASHQLRTPLTGIKGYLSMIVEGDYGKVPEKIRRILEEVFLNSDRLTRLVNIFLNVSRIESGRFDLNLKESDMVELINEVVTELKPSASQRQLKLTFHKPKILLPMMKIDRDKIKDVVLNLTDNAIKYTPEGRVDINISREDHHLKISVTDTGVGISTDEVTKLFEKFVRGSGIAQVDTSGSGLGLYIAKKIVEAHQGSIWAESAGKGQGSTFSFTLPVKK